MADFEIYGSIDARTVFIQLVDEHDLELLEQEKKELERLSAKSDWCIAAVKVKDWNEDLTPWKADAVFGKRGFGDGAGRTLVDLLDNVLPQLREQLSDMEGKPFICGYSLAGLFALWAVYETDSFAGAAAVSPSVWYPGWIEYAGEHDLKVTKVYLSLGTREEKARNPVMAKVGDAIREQHRMLSEAGVRCQLDWNPGNHFVDSDKRTAKGMAWLLSGE